MEKSVFLEITTQAFKAEDFLKICGFWGSFFYKEFSFKKDVYAIRVYDNHHSPLIFVGIFSRSVVNCVKTEKFWEMQCITFCIGFIVIVKCKFAVFPTKYDKKLPTSSPPAPPFHPPLILLVGLTGTLFHRKSNNHEANGWNWNYVTVYF